MGNRKAKVGDKVLFRYFNGVEKVFYGPTCEATVVKVKAEGESKPYVVIRVDRPQTEEWETELHSNEIRHNITRAIARSK